MDKEKQKNFLKTFFKEATIKEQKEKLIINNVEPAFEKFIGKKAPYTFVFDKETHEKNKETELITQGKYFLLAIRDYLQDKGKTSIRKILFKQQEKKLTKYSINKTATLYETIQEFTFITTCQYLNEKKQFMNTYHLQHQNIITLTPEKLSLQEGIREPLELPNLQELYTKALLQLQKRITKETKKIRKNLQEKLHQELKRITDHYHKQIKEKDEEVETTEEKIKLLKGKLKHTHYWRDKETINRTIRETEERLEQLQKRSYKERLRQEEQFHTQDEIEKHALNINHKLINLTIYYYPLLELTYQKKQYTYDPLHKKITRKKTTKKNNSQQH